MNDLSACIELKLQFPFEHLIIDCIYFVGLANETSLAAGHESARTQEVEKIFKMYLAMPIPEVRERLLRRIYQKIRAGTQQVGERPKALCNNLYLARFLLRKAILNHFVNGILINKDIASAEETKLQMSIGQLIVKIMILSFNEVQGITATNTAPPA